MSISPTLTTAERVTRIVRRAREARQKARNFAAINHKAIAAQWREYAADCMDCARTVKNTGAKS